MRVFESIGVSINVLEYFAAMFFIMLWVDTLRGQRRTLLGVATKRDSIYAALGRARQSGTLPQALVQGRDTARELSRAPATQRAYKSALNSWARICSAIGQPVNARSAETGQVWSTDEAETAVAFM
jgi:hypothetical protein